MDTATITDRYEEFKQYTADDKGRVFGYVAVLTEADGKFYGCVQKAVKTKDWYKSWGAAQGGKEFPSMKEARQWAFATQKERGEKLRGASGLKHTVKEQKSMGER